MAHPRLPDSARVPIGLNVSEADAVQIDEVLARPEFAGWTRAEWCREIIRSALRYYAGNAPAADSGQTDGSAPPAAAQPVPAGQQAAAETDSLIPESDEPSPAVPPAAAETAPAEPPEPPEPPDQPECAHPADAWNYETGTCGACGAVL
jgi:hypothetical protein